MPCVFISFSSEALLERAKMISIYILISKTKVSFSQGAVSELLLSNSTQTNSAWREDLETDMSSKDWESVCTKAHTQSCNTILRPLQ